MNTDTKYNKLEIVVTGIGDFIMTDLEDSNSKCWNRECNGNWKEDVRENIQGL